MYVAIAAHRRLRRLPLTELVGLSGPRIDAAVRGLVQRGLLSIENDSLVAAPPYLAGEGLLMRRMDELHEARVLLEELTDLYRTASGEHTSDELVELLPGHVVAQRLAQIQSRARTEVMMVDAPPYIGALPTNYMQLEQLATHITYRTVYDRRGLEMAGGFERARHYVAAGEQARVLDRAPVKMVIVDREYALIPQQRDLPATEGGSFLIYRSPLLDTLVSYFEMLWMCGLPLDLDGRGASPADLSAEENQLLTLLLAGFTDDAICRQLGVARRTVVRRVRALMDRAGAATRMQLGWQAAQLGWVTAPWLTGGLLRKDIPTAATGTGDAPAPMARAGQANPLSTSRPPGNHHRDINRSQEER